MPTPGYSHIAESLAAAVNSGRMRVGERLPSVRLLARQRQVSPTTAVAALRLLEQQGLIEARPRSGYFVAPRSPSMPAPRRSPVSRTAHGVAADDLASVLLAAGASGEPISLGEAIPDPAWFPARNLQRRIVALARSNPRLVSEYGPLTGVAALKHEIARRYARLGCWLDESELVITNGCMEALNLAIRAVAEPGATIAVESPAYFGFLQIIAGFGMKALEIATHPTSGLSVAALAQALQKRNSGGIKACVLTSSFSNPLGATLSDSDKQLLVRLCREHRIALIEDDVYGDLGFTGQRPVPAKSHDRHGNVILCSSFSKCLAPGARIGWLAGGQWSARIQQRKHVASVATPVLLQHVLADFLANDGYERHLRKLRQACAVHVAEYSRAIAACFPAGTRLSRPEGGFVLWVELPANVDAQVLQRRARRENIIVLPGSAFSASGRFRNCLRINCGRSWSPRLAAALQRLGQLAAQ